MNVKEVYGLFGAPEEVIVSMDGRQYLLKQKKQTTFDEMVMRCTGNYIVEYISAYGDECYVINVKMIPAEMEVSV